MPRPREKHVRTIAPLMGLFLFLLGTLIGVVIDHNIPRKVPPPVVEKPQEPPPNTKTTHTTGTTVKDRNRDYLPGAAHSPENPPTQHAHESDAKSEVKVSPPMLPTPVIAQPDWNRSQNLTVEDYVFDVPPCIFRGANLYCFFRATNEGDGEELRLQVRSGWYTSRLFADDTNEHPAIEVRLGNSVGKDARNVMPRGVPMLACIIFTGVPLNSSRARLIEIMAQHDTPGHSERITLKDVPITGPNGPAAPLEQSAPQDIAPQ